MFEVSWADPNVETVGQHRARKARERQARQVLEAASDPSSSDRPSSSSTGSASSGPVEEKQSDSVSKAKTFSLNTLRNKVSKLALRAPTPTSRATSATRPNNLFNHKEIAVEDEILKDDLVTNRSSFGSGGRLQLARHEIQQCVACVAVESNSLAASNNLENNKFGDSIPKTDGENSTASRMEVNGLPILTAPGSVHASWPFNSNSAISLVAAKSLMPVEEREELGPGSFVTRRTEVRMSADNSIPGDFTHREVRISANPSTNPEDSDTAIRKNKKLLNLAKYRSSSSMTGRSKTSTEISSDITEPWAAPSEWEYIPKDSEQSSKISRDVLSSKMNGARSSSQQEIRLVSGSAVSPLQKAIRQMEIATPAMIQRKLTNKIPDLENPQLYKEFEFEKQLWLLSALRYLGPGGGEVGKRIGVPVVPPIGTTKVLSLYESQAAAAFLATYTVAGETHHISCTPLDASKFPDGAIRPCFAPTVNQKKLSFMDSHFSSIYCLNFPTVLPTYCFPGLIQECSRLLLPTGTLCITIMDPTPVPHTTGPKLRDWLQDNLVDNLVEVDICIKPSEIVPRWLSHNGFVYNPLQGERIDFFAVPQPQMTFDHAELSTTAGRLLWKTLWGGWVRNKTWWWEDDDILEECANFNTHWAYHLASCVKNFLGAIILQETGVSLTQVSI